MYIFIYPRRVGRPTTPSKRAGRSSVLKVTRHLTLLGAMAATLAAADVQAQTGWPAGTIKLVVAYPPGGSTDVIARLVQPCLQERLATAGVFDDRSRWAGSVVTAGVVTS